MFAGALAAPAIASARNASARSGSEGDNPQAADSALNRFYDHIPDWSRPIIALLIALVLILWLRSAIAKSRSRRLERQTARLSDDIHVMQSALVPELPSQMGALAASVAYRPADGPATGGDFYDMFAMPGGRVAIIAGDAAGHGREAIARATGIRYRLRAYLEIGLSPREALRSAGRVLTPEAGDTAFATAILGIYDEAEGTLTYASAGHPPPILTGPGEHEPVTACASPALGWGFPTGMRETTIRLDRGSVACFYTDGLAEARRDGEMIGRERLTALVGDLPDEDPAQALIERVRATADNAPDDMAALVLEVTTPSAGQPLRTEQLEVTPDELRGGLAETFLHACGLEAEEVLRAMKIVWLAGRGGRPVLVEAEFSGSLVAVEALERLADDVVAPPFIRAAPESRVELVRAPAATTT